MAPTVLPKRIRSLRRRRRPLTGVPRPGSHGGFIRFQGICILKLRHTRYYCRFSFRRYFFCEHISQLQKKTPMFRKFLRPFLHLSENFTKVYIHKNIRHCALQHLMRSILLIFFPCNLPLRFLHIFLCQANNKGLTLSQIFLQFSLMDFVAFDLRPKRL